MIRCAVCGASVGESVRPAGMSSVTGRHRRGDRLGQREAGALHEGQPDYGSDGQQGGYHPAVLVDGSGLLRDGHPWHPARCRRAARAEVGGVYECAAGRRASLHSKGSSAKPELALGPFECQMYQLMQQH